MPRAFADITFTDSVKAAQALYGSREHNRGFELSDDKRNELTDLDAEFIEQRDSFYQASVSETGWPYVQHRGGPAGFLKVLNSRTIGYADFRGNRQYISIGNINSDDRVSLILMDYANRRRVKIWGRAQIIHASDHPDVLSLLKINSYSAVVERAVLIHIEAIEWNCPQHITPRFTEAEVKRLVAPIIEENIQLKKKNMTNEKKPTQLGEGKLPLVISGIRQLTPRIRAYELRATDGSQLPLITPGSHLQVPVPLSNGKIELHYYSICSNPTDRNRYEIAVLSNENGKGGSQAIHEQFTLGLQLNCESPKNHFHLHADASPALFIAGGIGITPIKPMAQTLALRGRRFQLHYAGRSLIEMAFNSELATEFGRHFFSYPKDENKRMDIMYLLADAPHNAIIYVCGPRKLIDDVYASASALGIAKDRIQTERFTISTEETNKPAILELIRSNKLIQVAADQSLLTAVRDAGVNVNFDCCVGDCGSCATQVLEGDIEHRDHVLNDAQKAKGMMCLCVSRAKSEKLILDL